MGLKIIESSQLLSRHFNPSKIDIFSPDILYKNIGRSHHVSLNRPLQLNALTLPMIHTLTDRISKLSKSNFLIVVNSTSNAFCSGGDLKQLYENKLSGSLNDSEDYFQSEYKLVDTIINTQSPIIAIMDGVASYITIEAS